MIIKTLDAIIIRVVMATIFIGCSMPFLNGCKPGCCPLSPAPAPTNEEIAVADPQEAQSQSETTSLTVKDVNWDALQSWVAEQKGKVVVVDLWSTWCDSCKREFPHFVELHEKMKDSVACASLSLDYSGKDGKVTEDVTEQVTEYLKSQKATMVHFIASEGDEATMKRVDVASIPAALVFDREGKLHKVFKNDDNEYGDEGFTYEKHITPLVEQLAK